MIDDVLTAVKQAYLVSASNIKPSYTEVSIDYMLNEYVKAVDNGDEINKNIFFSGLMLRFWYKIGRLADENKNLCLERIEFHDWVQEAILLACQYRGWQNKKKHITGQQAIQQCISTIRVRYYYQINLNKNKMGQVLKSDVNVVRLDAPINGYDLDSDTTYSEVIADTTQETNGKNFYMDELLYKFVKNNRIVEAIILDCIRDTDCTKMIKVRHPAVDGHSAYNTFEVKLQRNKIFETIEALPKNYATKFAGKHNIDKKIAMVAVDTLKNATTAKKYRYLNAVLDISKRYLSHEN